MSDKNEFERSVVEGFATAAGLDLQIVDATCEQPDVICKIDSREVGIELARIKFQTNQGEWSQAHFEEVAAKWQTEISNALKTQCNLRDYDIYRF